MTDHRPTLEGSLRAVESLKGMVAGLEEKLRDWKLQNGRLGAEVGRLRAENEALRTLAASRREVPAGAVVVDGDEWARISKRAASQAQALIALRDEARSLRRQLDLRDRVETEGPLT